jgi:zinc/manganese transport system substrate-binding protein
MMPPPWLRRIWLLTAITASLLRGADAGHRLVIITCNTVVNDITLHVAGDDADIQCLLAPGMDPHTYQPVPEDARRLAHADLVVVNGLGFEGWSGPLLQEAGYTGKVVVASQGVTVLMTRGSLHAPGGVPDPHAFNDLANGVIYAQNIRDALESADPDHHDDYEQWTAEYLARLRLLDAWVKRQLAGIAPAQRKLVTDHDALEYFAAAYGFTVQAPDSAMEDSQPGVQEVARLIEFITAQQVHGVFFEHGKSPKLMEQISREAHVRIGEDLYLDGVGPVGSLSNSYAGMFLSNVRTLVRTLR